MSRGPQFVKAYANPCNKEVSAEDLVSVQHGFRMKSPHTPSNPPPCPSLSAADVTFSRNPSLLVRPSILRTLLYSAMMLASIALLLMYWTPLGNSAPAATKLTNQDWIPRTQAAVDTLQKWYNPDTGLWDTTNWWNAANILTMLGNYALLNPAFKSEFELIARTTHTKAPGFKVPVLKVRTPTTVNTYTYPNIPAGLEAPPASNALDGFLNWYYDDEGWWALAWLKAYDVTKDFTYLQEAMNIFKDMTTGYDASCGGIWWNKGHQANVAITNELFLAIAAQLANRAPSYRRQYYLDWVWRHWAWFRKAGFIGPDGSINDGLDLATCRNNNGTVWSYNQGVITGALAEANATGKYQRPDAIPVLYNYYASRTLYAAYKRLQDSNGIIHDACEPNCGNDGPQFKGVFMRNIQTSRAFLQRSFGQFDKSRVAIAQNAASIWTKDRDLDNHMGLVWSGPYLEATAATQSSALDALVAAIDIQLHPT